MKKESAMKKALKIIGIVLGVFILVLLAAVLFINFKPLPTYEVKAPDIQVEADSQMLARGEHLAHLSCADCHIGKDGKWSGRFIEDGPFGLVHSANITRHPEAGIGRYTDGELLYLLRTGIARDGHMTMPMMPRLVHMSDEDIKSIVAYLKSDARVLEPSETKQPAVQYSLLAKALLAFGFEPQPYPGQSVNAPAPSNKVAYGKYLATTVVECFGCHSADFTKVDIITPENSAGYFGGGNKLLDPKTGEVIICANLTPDVETGIGAWTEEEFGRAVRAGQGKNGPLHPVMPRFTNFTDEEISAMWAYLQTIPAISNDVVAKAEK